MAQYKVLVAGSGNTKLNGRYPFSLKVGETVEGVVSPDGRSINISFPQLGAPGKPSPIAKLNPKYLSLKTDTTPVVSNVPTLSKEEVKQAMVATEAVVKSQAGVDIGKDGATFMNNAIWYPYLGIGIGYFIAMYVGNKRNSTALGYFGWTSLFATLGVIAGVALMVKSMKGQTDSVASKLSSSSGESKDSQIKNKVNTLVDKVVKVAPKLADADPEIKKRITPENIAKGKAKIASNLDTAIAKLTDKEKSIVIDGLTSVDKIADKVSADADKGVKQDLLVLLGYFAEIQAGLFKKYSQKEIDDLGKKLSSLS